jgi:hypothetical protein
MKRTASDRKAREEKMNHMTAVDLEISKYKPLL